MISSHARNASIAIVSVVSCNCQCHNSRQHKSIASKLSSSNTMLRTFKWPINLTRAEDNAFTNSSTFRLLFSCKALIEFNATAVIVVCLCFPVGSLSRGIIEDYHKRKLINVTFCCSAGCDAAYFRDFTRRLNALTIIMIRAWPARSFQVKFLFWRDFIFVSGRSIKFVLIRKRFVC